MSSVKKLRALIKLGFSSNFITFFKPGIVAESAMNFCDSSSLLFLSAIMWSKHWESLLLFFPLWLLAFAFGSKLLLLLDVKSTLDFPQLLLFFCVVACIMVDLSKDRINVLGVDGVDEGWSFFLELSVPSISLEDDKLLPEYVTGCWSIMSLKNSSSSSLLVWQYCPSKSSTSPNSYCHH